MKRIFQSLRARLSFWVMLICVIVFGAIATVFHFYSFDREEKGAIRFTGARMEAMALSIERKVQAVEFSLERAVPQVERHLDNPESMAELVEKWVRSDTLIMGGSIAFRPNYYPKEGRYFMEYVYLDSANNTVHLRLGGDKYDYLNKKWFKNAVKQKRAQWSEPYVDEGGGQVAMITYSLPLRDSNGDVYAVITADVAISTLINEISSLQTYKDSRILMTSEDGEFITHWDRSRICNGNISQYAAAIGTTDAAKVVAMMKTGRSGSMEIEMADKDALAFYTTVPHLKWHICAFCTYQSIMGQLLGTSLTIIAIFLVGLLLLSVCIHLILRHEMRPLEKMAKVARTMGRGEFNVEIPSVDGNDELRSLHDSFQLMQQSLVEYIKELKDITASKQRIESELHIAHALQMSLIPNIFPPFPERNDIDLYASLTPAKEVGGDLYDFFIREEKLFFTVGDVSGKGIPASLFMAITRSLFRMVANVNDSPAEMARQLNNYVADGNDTNMFVTMFIGVLDLKTSVMTVCNAGHNPPLALPVNSPCHYMDVEPNLPIGIMKAFDYVEQQFDMNGTALLVYTDGVTEAEDPDNRLFGEQRLRDACEQLRGETATNIIKNIYEMVKQHAANKQQSDDITMLVLKYDH